MNAKMKNVVCLMSVLMAVGMGVRGDVLAEWITVGQLSNSASNPPTSGVATWEAQTKHTNIEFATWSRGSGAAASGTLKDTFAWINSNQVSLADAINQNVYASINFSATNGYQYELDQIKFWLSVNNRGNGRHIALLSSVDAWEENNVIFQSEPSADKTEYAVDLSALSFTNLTNVEFRLYTWGSSGQYDSTGLGYDNDWNSSRITMTIDGTVSAIPEPSTMALLGIALGSALFFRRRKH